MTKQNVRKNKRKPNKRSQSKNTPEYRGVSLFRILFTLTIAGLFVYGIAQLAELSKPASQKSEQTPNIADDSAKSTKSSSTTSETGRIPEIEYSFYEKLKQDQVTVDVTPETSNSKDRQLLAGSFKTAAQAESRLVELKLLGLDPTISKQKIRKTDGQHDGKKEIWYRVILGPFEDVGDYRQAIAITEKNDIDVALLKGN